MKSSTTRIALGVLALGSVGFLLSSPGNATVRTEACGTISTLQNGSFESGSTSWNTTAVDGAFEIWGPRSTTRPNSSTFNISAPSDSYTHDEQYIAELQANTNGGSNQGLYQDIATTPGAQIFVSFWHHFRTGVDSSQSVTARVGSPPANVPAGATWTQAEQNASQSFGTSIASNTATANEDWEQARAVYTVPSGQNTTRFLFTSSGSANGGYGNLLDDIEFTPFLACPVTRAVTFGTPDSFNAVTTDGVTYGIDQTISAITSASNSNGSAGTATRNGNTISFTPTAAGSGQTVDYTASMTFSGTNYTDEARITYNVSATVPAAPTALSATTSGNDVTLSWTAPTNNGGVAISDYIVEFRQGTGSWQTFSDGVSSTASATVTGLTGTNSYSFRVSAKNDGSGYSGPGTTGTGALSAVLDVAAWVCSDLDEFDQISGLLLWLRADCVNGNTTLPSDGAAVTTWQDLSDNNNDATVMSGQTSPTFQNDSGNLINGQPIINFTRTSDSAGSVFQVNGVDIRAMTNPDVSIFVVYKPRRVSGDDAEINGVWGADTGGWDRFFLSKFQNFGDDGLISLGPGSSNTTSARVTGSAVNGTTRLLTAIYDGNVTGTTNSGAANASEIYFGSTLVTSFADTTTGGSDAQPRLYIGWDGDGSAFRGDIAEFIVFDRALDGDLPSINEYLNARYNLSLEVDTDLPDVVLVDPRSTAVNIPSLALSTSTNAMICFSQVGNSAGATLSGNATIGVSRTSVVSGVTENTGTNLWRYNGARADVETQVDSIQITGTGSNPVVSSGSKWLRVHVTSATAAASDCTDGQVDKVVELRSLALEDDRSFSVDID